MKTKNNNYKNIVIFSILILILICIVLFLTAPVFRARGGAVNPYINLNIINAYIADKNETDEVKITNDNRTLSFNVYYEAEKRKLLNLK